MKSFFTIGIMILLIFCEASFVSGKVNQEWIQWARGEFEIPPEIQTTTKIYELKPFLNSKDEFAKMAAIRKLGQLNDEKVIKTLIEKFAEEPYEVLMLPEGIPIVKLEIIRTLQKVGNEEAKTALISIVREYWEKGPRVKDRKYSYNDGDFTTVVPLLLESLCKWSKDDDVFKVSQEIALSKDLEKYFAYPSEIRQNAWELYLKGYMAKQGLSEKDSAKYLIKLRRDISKNGIDSTNLEGAKIKGIYAILEDMSEATLSYIKKEAEKDLAQLSPTNLKEKSFIKSDIYTIEEILKKKEKKKEK